MATKPSTFAALAILSKYGVIQVVNKDDNINPYDRSFLFEPTENAIIFKENAKDLEAVIPVTFKEEAESDLSNVVIPPKLYTSVSIRDRLF